MARRKIGIIIDLDNFEKSEYGIAAIPSTPDTTILVKALLHLVNMVIFSMTAENGDVTHYEKKDVEGNTIIEINV